MCSNLLTVLRGRFTPIGLIHLSLLLPSPFLSFCSSLFSFSSFLFLSSLLFFFFWSLPADCLSWKVHPPTAMILYSPSDYWLTWLIKILPIMWQICQNLPTKKKNEVWLLFVNLPTCTHLSVTSLKPDRHGSDQTLYHNLTSCTHLSE